MVFGIIGGVVMPHNKFGARKTVVDGITFDSAKEARRYSVLRLLEKAGEITHLVLQPRIPLKVDGVLVCTIIPDFSYIDQKTRKKVFEDPKGMKTPIYRLKRKLLLALFPGTDHREI
jgi:hypothetical protein